MKRSRKLLLAALPAVLFGSSLFAQSPQSAVPVKVKATEVRQQSKALVDEVVGTVAARTKPVVSAQINGTVVKTLAETGQRVKAGDLLAELASPEADARLSGAKASLELAAREFSRSEQLASGGTISKSAFDQAKATFESAKAALKEAETAVAYKQVLAPIGGVIRSRRVDPGEITLPGKPLFEMEDEQNLRLEANVAESLSAMLRTGARIAVRIDSADRLLTGTLSEITPSADPLSRTFLVRLDLPQTTGVMSGQFGRAFIPAGSAAVLLVPSSAVVPRGQMETVFVVENGTAKLRLVRTGKSSDGMVELLSGVEPGERVVTSGVPRLSDGEKVEVEQ